MKVLHADEAYQNFPWQSIPPDLASYIVSEYHMKMDDQNGSDLYIKKCA